MPRVHRAQGPFLVEQVPFLLQPCGCPALPVTTYPHRARHPVTAGWAMVYLRPLRRRLWCRLAGASGPDVATFVATVVPTPGRSRSMTFLEPGPKLVHGRHACAC